MEIVNLTPHEVVLVRPDREVRVPASGTVARVAVSTRTVGVCDADGVEIPLVAPEYGAVCGLPEARTGTLYLVSRVVKDRVADRDDVLVPADFVRDAAGRITGCRALSL